MPSPLLPSLITMIGCNVVSAAFALHFKSPRHSARRPATELAPPTSTPNSVRWTGTCSAAAAGAGDFASSAAETEATTAGGGGAGAATTASAGFSGPISFEAAASGGAISDLDAISDVAGGATGVTAGGVGAACATAAAVAGGGTGAR